MTTTVTTQPTRPPLRHYKLLLGALTGIALAASIAIGVGHATDDRTQAGQAHISGTAATCPGNVTDYGCRTRQRVC